MRRIGIDVGGTNTDAALLAAVRIGLPPAASLPPVCDWSDDLADLVRGDVLMIEGGRDYNVCPFVRFDKAAMRHAARWVCEHGIAPVAVAAVFSPVDRSCVERARAMLAEELFGSLTGSPGSGA
jgi:N-methylhydantoinase A/oxoprolinase/acetone carboxylase beta subunit